MEPAQIVGIVGIGGGVLMVPFLYFVYECWGAGLGWTVPMEDGAARRPLLDMRPRWQ